MEFNYKDIRIGDLEVEFNYINFGFECDGDNHIVKCEMIQDKLED